jgi:hypothetical protein
VSVGAAHRFEGGESGNLLSVNLNQLDSGGNVYVSPNGGLFFRVSPLRYWKQAGGGAFSCETYAGAPTDQAVAQMSTVYVWLAAAGTLATGAGFPAPATAFLPLAVIVTNTTAIASITDARPRLVMPAATA